MIPRRVRNIFELLVLIERLTFLALLSIPAWIVGKLKERR